MIIKNNFWVVSNYNNNIDWIKDYSENYFIYDRSDTAEYTKNFAKEKVKKVPNIGHNIFDYLTFIIDNYSHLPDCVILLKGNVFPRHVSKEYFDRIINNNYFTPIEDYRMHQEKWPVCFFSSDGGFCEINNSWYLNHHPTKYFHNYNDFLRFCFKDPVIPRYIRFAPGANYIVPKENILKLPRIFYENLKIFVSHCQTAIPGESHIIERAFHTLWTCNFELNEKMLVPIDKNFVAIPPRPKNRVVLSVPQRLIRKSKHIAKKLLNKINTFKKSMRSTNEIAEYRKKIKIYDIFTFFNELELLEIRLNILNDYVDYFVIVEATQTFSGLPKRLFYKENKNLFEKYGHKIIHYVIDDAPENEDDLQNRLLNKNLGDMDKEIINNALTSNNVLKGVVHWLKEFYQKESIKKALVGLSDEDVCFVSDVDEIWNPEAKIDYTKDDIFKLRQKMYAYYLNNRSNEPWAGTIVTKYKNIKNSCLNHLRTVGKTKYAYVKNGGWHFTNQGGAERIQEKIEASYGPEDFNNDDIKSQIKSRMIKNRDYIGRNFTFRTDERNLPKYILDNKIKYKEFFK